MTRTTEFWRFLPQEAAPDREMIRAAGEAGKGALARTLREARFRLGASRSAALLRAARGGETFGRPVTMLVAAPFQPRAMEDALLVACAIAGLDVELRFAESLAALAEADAGIVDEVDMTLLLLLDGGPDASAMVARVGEAVARRTLAPAVVLTIGGPGGPSAAPEAGVEALHVPFEGPAIEDRFGQTFGHLPNAEASERLADAAAAFAARLRGSAPKLVVTDLDGTLWAGMLGEDGAASLVLHRRYADALKSLTRRGFVLAAASRNDPADVDAAFAAHPDWPLGRADFTVQAIGWAEKDVLVGDVLARLSLAPEHLLFVDDDAVNCAKVAARFPDADVRFFSGDPDGFAAMLAADPLLAGTASSDGSRAEAYRKREAVERLRAEAPDVGAFLKRLETRLTVVPLEASACSRAAELAARVNQFALTDCRPNALQLAARGSKLDFLIRLDDAFGAHGLVGLVLARAEHGSAVIENVLLSCRALGRNIEDVMIHALANLASRNGLGRIEGSIERLERNEPARQCFSRYAVAQGGDRFVIRLDQARAELPEGTTLSWTGTT